MANKLTNSIDLLTFLNSSVDSLLEEASVKKQRFFYIGEDGLVNFEFFTGKKEAGKKDTVKAEYWAVGRNLFNKFPQIFVPVYTTFNTYKVESKDLKVANQILTKVNEVMERKYELYKESKKQ